MGPGVGAAVGTEVGLTLGSDVAVGEMALQPAARDLLPSIAMDSQPFPLQAKSPCVLLVGTLQA